MIQTVEVIIKNGLNITKDALLVYPKKTLYINRQKYQVEDSFIEEFLQTIYPWKNEYGEDGNIDSEEFIVIVKTKEGTEQFHGKGIYPHNYESLKELLEEEND